MFALGALMPSIPERRKTTIHMKTMMMMMMMMTLGMGWDQAAAIVQGAGT